MSLYKSLDRINSGYILHMYDQDRIQWGNGIDNTSRIEFIWAEINLKFKRIELRK